MLLQILMKSFLKALTLLFLSCSMGESPCTLLTDSWAELGLNPSDSSDPIAKLVSTTEDDFRCFNTLCLARLAFVVNFFPQLQEKRMVDTWRFT